MSDEIDAINAAIAEQALEPKSMTTDAGTTVNRDMRELAEAKKVLAANAGVSNPNRGLRFSRLVPPGAT